MNKEDRILLNQLIQEMSELRGEMKSFKEHALERIQATERKCDNRQSKPESCTIGRSLKYHIKNHKTTGTARHSVFDTVIEAGMLLTVILIALLK